MYLWFAFFFYQNQLRMLSGQPALEMGIWVITQPVQSDVTF